MKSVARWEKKTHTLRKTAVTKSCVMEEKNLKEPPNIVSGSQLSYYYDKVRGKKKGPLPVFCLLGGARPNRGARNGVFTASGEYHKKELWNEILPRHAWDVVNGYSMALASCKLGGRTNCMHFDFDFKNCPQAYGKDQFHAMGCLLLACTRKLFPGKQWSNDLPFLILCTTPPQDPVAKYGCSVCTSSLIVPKGNSWYCEDCKTTVKRKKTLMYNHGAHVHFAQFRKDEGQHVLFETCNRGTYRGTGPCLRRDNMLVFRSLVIHYWLELTRLLQKPEEEWSNIDTELAAETLSVFPAIRHLPEVNAQNVVNIVDLAIFGSERGELKPMNGSMRSVFTPKVKNCPQCEMYSEMEDGRGTCILCGGCGKVQDDSKVYSTDWGCILDFDGNRMTSVEDQLKPPTYTAILQLSRLTCMTLPELPSERWETPGFTVPTGFEGSESPTTWVDVNDTKTNNALVGMASMHTLKKSKNRYHGKVPSGSKVYLNIHHKEWGTIVRLIKEKFGEYGKGWNVHQIFYYQLKDSGQRSAYICSVDGKYASYCCNARKCKHGLLRRGGTNSQELSRKLNIGFCTDAECNTSRWGVHTQQSPLYIKLSPTSSSMGGKKTFRPVISLNCHSESGGFKHNTCCNKMNDYDKEQYEIGEAYREVLWPGMIQKKRKLKVNFTVQKGKRPQVNNVAMLFGLGKTKVRKKK